MTLTFLHANGGTTNRQCAVTVNGTNIGNVAFAPTGSWTTWSGESINATLANNSTNTIRLTANASNGSHLHLLGRIQSGELAVSAQHLVLADGADRSLLHSRRIFHGPDWQPGSGCGHIGGGKQRLWLAAWQWYNQSNENMVNGSSNNPQPYPPASNLTPFGVTVRDALTTAAPATIFP